MANNRVVAPLKATFWVRNYRSLRGSRGRTSLPSRLSPYASCHRAQGWRDIVSKYLPRKLLKFSYSVPWRNPVSKLRAGLNVR